MPWTLGSEAERGGRASLGTGGRNGRTPGSVASTGRSILSCSLNNLSLVRRGSALAHQSVV